MLVYFCHILLEVRDVLNLKSEKISNFCTKAMLRKLSAGIVSLLHRERIRIPGSGSITLSFHGYFFAFFFEVFHRSIASGFIL